VEETVSWGAVGQGDAGSASRGSRSGGFPQIEGYDIKHILGRGGMGVVYEAIQEKLNRPVALKLLPTVMSSAHPELVARFRREAAAAAKLHHTHIIPIYDFGASPDGYFYAMELLHGQPLSVLIKRLAAMDAPKASPTAIAELLNGGESPSDVEDREPQTPSTPSSGWTGSSTGGRGRPYYRYVAGWIADVADALHYAHLRGMIHRDIKPGNLMLCTDGRMMVLDFGLVKTVGDQSVTATGSLVGTYRYMSPEQVGAKRISVDARTDVYSLGVTLYELLTFQPAFAASEQSELLGQILFKEPLPPRKTIPSVPVDLQTICLKAMEKAPNERYQTAKAMADDLSSYLHDLAIVARPQGPVRRLVKLVRRRRLETMGVVAGVLLILLVAASVVGLRSRREERASREQARAALRLDLIKQGVHFWEKQDWDDAKRLFTEVLGLNPDDYGALVNLANVHKDEYYAGGDASLLREADELLNRAVGLKPDGYEAWNAKGVVYQAWGRTADAIDAFERVLKLDDSYFAAWVNLGMLQATQGDLHQAEQCLQKGIELVAASGPGLDTDAETVMPWRLLGAVQLQAGQPEAVQTLNTARAISNNQDVPTLVLCARYYLAQGGAENFRHALRLAVTANTLSASEEPGSPGGGPRDETRVRVKRILALAMLRNRQWEAAIDAAEEAIALGDQPAFAHLVLAVATGQLGNAAAAHEHLRLADAAWPEGLRRPAFRATQDGRSLWFDTAEELETLREEAVRLIGPLTGRNSSAVRNVLVG
jgi:serine/threonine protein kinase/Tfp pilus assembly protein PilF